jgi:hypothetical protein
VKILVGQTLVLVGNKERKFVFTAYVFVKFSKKVCHFGITYANTDQQFSATAIYSLIVYVDWYS